LLLCTVDGAPVILQNPACITTVGVPAPVGKAEIFLVNKLDKLALPNPFFGGGIDLSPAKLADQDGGNSLSGNVVEACFSTGG